MSKVIVDSDKVETVCPKTESKNIKLESKVAIIEWNDT